MADSLVVTLAFTLSNTESRQRVSRRGVNNQLFFLFFLNGCYFETRRKVRDAVKIVRED